MWGTKRTWYCLKRERPDAQIEQPDQLVLWNPLLSFNKSLGTRRSYPQLRLLLPTDNVHFGSFHRKFNLWKVTTGEAYSSPRETPLFSVHYNYLCNMLDISIYKFPLTLSYYPILNLIVYLKGKKAISFCFALGDCYNRVFPLLENIAGDSCNRLGEGATLRWKRGLSK